MEEKENLPISEIIKEKQIKINEPEKSGLHASLAKARNVLVVDEAGSRRDETIEILKTVLPNVTISVANSPELAEEEVNKNFFDTYVVNLLMPGYSSSNFVKAVHNNDNHPLLVGFSADKMSDAYDPKKGIKVKPLRKLFEMENPDEHKGK